MYTIKHAAAQDVDNIMSMIDLAISLLPERSWFVEDTREFFASHIKEKGFTLKAIKDGEMAAFLTIRFPHLEEDNYGYSLDFNEAKLMRVAHIESAVVHPDHRGNHLEYCLMKEAEEILKTTPYNILLGTVHPDNMASVKSFLNNGYHVAKTLKKYGGLMRHIMRKDI